MVFNELRPDTRTSVDAAGLPILPRLARYEEITADIIEHALRFTANYTANHYICPRGTERRAAVASTPSLLARFCIYKAITDISRFSQQAQVILEAVNTTAALSSRTKACPGMSAARRMKAEISNLRELKVLTGNDFDTVNTYAWMVNPNSVQVGEAVNPPLTQISNSQRAGRLGVGILGDEGGGRIEKHRHFGSSTWR